MATLILSHPGKKKNQHSNIYSMLFDVISRTILLISCLMQRIRKKNILDSKEVLNKAYSKL